MPLTIINCQTICENRTESYRSPARWLSCKTYFIFLILMIFKAKLFVKIGRKATGLLLDCQAAKNTFYLFDIYDFKSQTICENRTENYRSLVRWLSCKSIKHNIIRTCSELLPQPKILSFYSHDFDDDSLFSSSPRRRLVPYGT